MERVLIITSTLAFFLVLFHRDGLTLILRRRQSASVQNREERLEKKLRQAYYMLRTLVTSQSHSPDSAPEKNGPPAASYHHLLGLLSSRPLNMWAVMRLMDDEEFHDFVEFHLSLSFTPPEALYPNGFPAHSTDALPPSFRARAFWGSVAHFGTNCLLADAPPPHGGLHFRVMNPALKMEPTPVLHPSSLPGLNTYLKQNPLHQALPADAEDCPPEDQYVTPAIVARNVQPFLGLLPTPQCGPATKPFPRACNKNGAFLHEQENAHWTAITLMQGRAATVEQMSTVKVTGLPAATWLQVIQCLRLSHFDSAVVLSTMDEGTFNRCVEFIARLAHSYLHDLMGMAKPYASFIACPTARAWHGANHALGSCFSTPKPTKPAPSALQKPPTSAAEGHPDAAAAHLPGGDGATPMPSPHTTMPSPTTTPPLQSPPALRAGPRPLQPWPTTSPHPPPRVLPQAPPYPQLLTRSPPTRAPQVRPNGPRHLLLDARFPTLRSLKTKCW